MVPPSARSGGCRRRGVPPQAERRVEGVSRQHGRRVADRGGTVLPPLSGWETGGRWLAHAEGRQEVVRPENRRRRTRRFSGDPRMRSEEHTSELQSIMRISYAVLCLNK